MPWMPQLTPLQATLEFTIQPKGNAQPMTQHFYQDLADSIFIELVTKYGAIILDGIQVKSG